MVKQRIPNFSTLSTLMDRLSIENVKLAHFENALEHDNLSGNEIIEFQRKVEVQHGIIDELKKELVQFLEEVYQSKSYEYMKEERTFN